MTILIANSTNINAGSENLFAGLMNSTAGFYELVSKSLVFMNNHGFINIFGTPLGLMRIQLNVSRNCLILYPRYSFSTFARYLWSWIVLFADQNAHHLHLYEIDQPNG